MPETWEINGDDTDISCYKGSVMIKYKVKCISLRANTLLKKQGEMYITKGKHSAQKERHGRYKIKINIKLSYDVYIKKENAND